jgi:photosystem II stability/assembly factor-like uncharacterized protein
MKSLNITGVLAFALTILLSESTCAAQTLLSKDIISLAKEKGDSPFIYASSLNSVYQSRDNGKNWKKIYNTEKINKVYIDYNNVIYLATGGGLYVSRDRGDSWYKIYRGACDLENNCICLAVSQKALYLGTEGGLFISYNVGKMWQKSAEDFSDSVVSAIEIDPRKDNIVYVACEKGVFITQDEGKEWRKIYTIYDYEIPSEDYSDYDGEVSQVYTNIHDIAVSYQQSGRRVYIAVKGDIFFTEDEGSSWQKLTGIGLPFLNIYSILPADDSQQEFFMATDKGIFTLRDNLWCNLTKDLTHSEFYELIKLDSDTIYAAGKKGIFKINLKQDLTNANREVLGPPDEELNRSDLFSNEPTIAQVQKAAIKYADVDMAKIISWRRQARCKAFLPTLSVGYDKNVYGSSTGAMAIGPRGWDMDLSWDIGDLVWSSDQTSIDSRSRLTVQLRQDILNEVTNLYYERRRLKLELLMSPPQDELDKLRKQLEIEEITASLDGLTNGYFSKAIPPK